MADEMSRPSFSIKARYNQRKVVMNDEMRQSFKISICFTQIIQDHFNHSIDAV
jgi:hypothetical protein